jgi:hypothetical protein
MRDRTPHQRSGSGGGPAPPDVRLYLASETRRLLATGRFVDALPGFLLPDPATQQRLPLLRDRLAALAGADEP